MRLIIICLVLLGCTQIIQSQNLIRKALFLGNSYTYVNNLPALTALLVNGFASEHVKVAYKRLSLQSRGPHVEREW